VPGGPAACAHAPCVTLERRRSDFQRDARVTPFTGSCCCCCCCLHWIGAAAGGVIGMRLGLADRGEEARRPLARLGPAGAAQPASGSAAPSPRDRSSSPRSALGARQHSPTSSPYRDVRLLALAPSLVFAVVGVPLVLGAHGLRANMLAAFRADMMKLPAKDGSDKSTSLYRARLTVPPKTRDPLLQFSVFCPSCWADLGESMHLADLPGLLRAHRSPGDLRPRLRRRRSRGARRSWASASRPPARSPATS
jgi:hypothetical protein